MSKEINVSIVPFTHFDRSWLGTQSESFSRNARLISLAMQQMERDPSFHYHIEAGLAMDYFLQCHPEQYPRLANFIRDGRIEIGPSWVILHSDLQPGENLLRNFLYAKARLGRHFDFDIPTPCFQMSDMPGHTCQLPQILRQCDIDFFVMTRCGPENQRLFWWKAPDGTKILTYSIHDQRHHNDKASSRRGEHAKDVSG